MDKELLEYEIKKRGFGIQDFCKIVGIPRSTFYKKCTGQSEFRLDEINAIIDVLEIEDPRPIFFANKVS